MNSQSGTTLNHFSHPHPLQLTNYQSTHTTTASSCSGCKLQLDSDIIYSCRSCKYFLHKDCAKMPKKITHPFDDGHVLTLHTQPPYEENSQCYCDACGKAAAGKGFCYHCEICKIDLHIRCAVLPLTFTHQSHPHKLKLIFSPTHLNKTFNCDVCNTLGHNHWLYRCDSCDFDVHLNCRNVQVQRPNPPSFGAFPNQHVPQQSVPGFASSRSAPQVPPQPPPQFFQTPPVPTGFPATHPYHGIDPQVVPHLMRLQELIAAHQRMNQQQLQALMAGTRFGGPRTSGLGGWQHLIQAMTNGAGNGIGGGIPGLGGIGGGGGVGGVDFQSLLGGGGVGGVDLQSLLGGGGVGGVDFQSLLGGGNGFDMLGSMLGGGFGLF